MKLGQMIAAARKEKGLTLRQLEKETGIRTAVICRMETGKSVSPLFFSIVKIAGALDVELATLATADAETAFSATARKKQGRTARRTWKRLGPELAAAISAGAKRRHRRMRKEAAAS